TLTGNSAIGGQPGPEDHSGDQPHATAGSGLGNDVFNRNGSVSSLNNSFDSAAFNTVTGTSAVAAPVPQAALAAPAAARRTTRHGGSIFSMADGGTAHVTLNNTIVAGSPNGAPDFKAVAIHGGTHLSDGFGNLIENNAGFQGEIVSSADP